MVAEVPPLNRKKPYPGPGSCGETDYQPGRKVDGAERGERLYR